MFARIRAKVQGIFHGPLLYHALSMGLIHDQREGVSLGGGGVRIPGYWDIDICHTSDLVIDLSKTPLPFRDQSMKYAVCISVISYFPYDKASFLLKEIFRVLKKGGIIRFGVPDLYCLAKKYVEGDREFFFQKLPNGHDRFEGEKIADKFNTWFSGHKSWGGVTSTYMYDYESLAHICVKAGFSCVERKAYRESQLEDVELIDNREDHMFFLEAVK